jgi:hypothetical protein
LRSLPTIITATQFQLSMKDVGHTPVYPIKNLGLRLHLIIAHCTLNIWQHLTPPTPAKEPDMTSITITFSVEGVNPTKIDPHELADYLLDLAAEEVRANGTDDRWGELAADHMSAEWETL